MTRPGIPRQSASTIDSAIEQLERDQQTYTATDLADDLRRIAAATSDQHWTRQRVTFGAASNAVSMALDGHRAPWIAAALLERER